MVVYAIGDKRMLVGQPHFNFLIFIFFFSFENLWFSGLSHFQRDLAYFEGVWYLFVG